MGFCSHDVCYFRGRALCQEGLQPGKAPADRRAQPSGDQAHAELQVQGVRQGDLLLAVLLLVPHQRWHRAPAQLPQPAV